MCLIGIRHYVKTYKKAVFVQRKDLEERLNEKKTKYTALMQEHDRLAQPANVAEALKKVGRKKR